jgi:hypothetical protein
MVRQAQPVKWPQRFSANLKRSTQGASADERELREFARAITNHLLLITSVNFLILPFLLLPFTVQTQNASALDLPGDPKRNSNNA